MVIAFCAHYPNGTRRRHFKTALTCSAGSPTRPSSKPANAGTIDHTFAKWAISNSVDMSKLDLVTFSASTLDSRGMVANTSIKKGQPLISISTSTALQVTSLDTKKSPMPSKISDQTWQKLPWFVRLALLVYRAKKDTSSPYHIWTQKLPTKFDTPFHWNEEQLKQLQNEWLVERVKEQRKLYRKWFDMINRNADNQLARGMKFEVFVNVVECVRSRAFSGQLEVAPFKERLRVMLFIVANVIVWPAAHILPVENALNGGLTALFALALYDIFLPRILRFMQGVQLKRYAMTPGIDFINHSSAVTSIAEVSYEYFSEKFVVESGEDYDQGEQVFLSYGAQSNDAFLQYYGFVEENNPAESYTFGKEVTKLLGVEEGKLIAKRSGFSELVVNSVTKKLGGEKQAAEEALRKLCEAELECMPTSIEEDEALLKDSEMETNVELQLAVRYRLQKKILLEELAKVNT